MTYRATGEVPSTASLLRCLACVACMGGLLFTSTSTAQTQTGWPTMATPKGVDTFDMGVHVNVKGVPVRMRGFVSAATPSQLALLYRQSWGEPLVEDAVGSTRVLGRAQGQYYVTVQIVPVDGGTRGVIAISDVGSAIAAAESTRSAEQRLLARLPAGTRLLS